MKNQVQNSIRKKINFETHFEPILDQFGDPKSIEHRSKNGIELGVPLGIDFWSTLMDFGGQVGAGKGSQDRPRQAKIGQDMPRQARTRQDKRG